MSKNNTHLKCDRHVPSKDSFELSDDKRDFTD